MKKIFFITTLVVVISNYGFSQARIGIQGGTNVAITQYETNEDDDLTNKARFGVVAGVMADIPFGAFSFRPEINFIQKGYKNENESSRTDFGITTTEFSKSKARFNYMEIPLNVVYNIPAGCGKAYLGLGANFGLGMGGNVVYDETVTIAGLGTETKSESSNTMDVRFDGKENNGSDNKYHLKRFDFGGNILAGYQMDMGLFFNLGYTLGLSDISPNSSDNSATAFSQKNHGVHLKVGYLFGCKPDNKKTTTGSTSTGANF